ncbi:hypothetical protein AAMO2058_000530700 [Amorphochlora amoebiformis]
MALAQRWALHPLKDVPYNFNDVESSKKDLSNSIAVRVRDRDVWFESMSEALLLCNEAAVRSKKRQREKAKSAVLAALEFMAASPNFEKICTTIVDYASGTFTVAGVGKPLSLEYIADRVDLDDPIWGYMIRTQKEGWLQGFITMTTFTTWHRWFQWNTYAPEAGVIDYSDRGKGLDEQQREHIEWMKSRKIDHSGALAREMKAEIFDGDPKDQGVIWPHIAELSLLGALGCGAALVRAAIEELENTKDSPYKYVVLQATEHSVCFYERMGFIRVGALCRHEHHKDDGNSDNDEDSKNSDSDSTDTDQTSNDEDSTSSDDAGDNSSSTKTSDKQEGKRHRKKRDKNAPKKACSPYVIFFRDVHRDIKSEHPNSTAVQLAKLAGQRWNQMDEKSKAVYKKRSEEDKIRYIKEKSEYDRKRLLQATPSPKPKKARPSSSKKGVGTKSLKSSELGEKTSSSKEQKSKKASVKVVKIKQEQMPSVVRIVLSNKREKSPKNRSRKRRPKVSKSPNSQPKKRPRHEAERGGQSGTGEMSLVDRVVKVEGGIKQENSDEDVDTDLRLLDDDKDFEYWLVRTVETNIATLAPLVRVGKFSAGEEKGMVRWKVLADDEAVVKTINTDRNRIKLVRAKRTLASVGIEEQEWAIFNQKCSPIGKKSSGSSATVKKVKLKQTKLVKVLVGAKKSPVGKKAKKSKKEIKEEMRKLAKKTKPKSKKTAFQYFLSSERKKATAEKKAEKKLLAAHRDYTAQASHDADKKNSTMASDGSSSSCKRKAEAAKGEKRGESEGEGKGEAEKSSEAMSFREKLEAVWERLSGSDKEVYIQMEKRDAERYTKEMQKWEKMNPRRPKKPATAYLLFSIEQNKRIKEEGLSIPFAEISRMVSDQWSKLTDDDKAKYKLQSEKAQAKYQEEMKDYNAKMLLIESARQKSEQEKTPKTKVEAVAAEMHSKKRDDKKRVEKKKKKKTKKKKKKKKKRKKDKRNRKVFKSRSSPSKSRLTSPRKKAAKRSSEPNPTPVIPAAKTEDWGTVVEDPKKIPIIALKGISSRYLWYITLPTDTPASIAQRFHMPVSDIVFFNRRLHPDLKPSSGLYGGTFIRIPKITQTPPNPNPNDKPKPREDTCQDANHVDENAPADGESGGKPGEEYREEKGGGVAKEGELGREKGGEKDAVRRRKSRRIVVNEAIFRKRIEKTRGPNILRAKENETIQRLAKRLGMDANRLLEANRNWYDGISLHSKLMRGTVLLIPRQDEIELFTYPDPHRPVFATGKEVDLSQLTEKSCYRHWAFKTDSLEHTQTSYMMALKLKRPNPSDGEYTTQDHGYECKLPAQLPVVRSKVVRDPPKIKQTRDVFDPLTFERIPAPIYLPPVDLEKEAREKKALEEALRKEIDEMDVEEGRWVGIKFKLGTEPVPLDKAKAGPFEIERLVSVPKPRKGKKRGRKSKIPPKPEFVQVKKKFSLFLTDNRMAHLPTNSRLSPINKRRKKIQNHLNLDTNPKEKKHVPERDSSHPIQEGGEKTDEERKKERERRKVVDPPKLFDKVVKVAEAPHKYYFVLTWIPDLRWCRVCPMHPKDGTIEDNNHMRWVLMPEDLGQELDVTSARCSLVDAKPQIGAEDADQEEWLIPADDDDVAAAAAIKPIDVDLDLAPS